MDSSKVAILVLMVFLICDLCANVVVCIRLRRRKIENDSTRKISGKEVNKVE